MFTSYCVFDLFTFPEHKFLYNRDKFLYEITVAITFQTDEKIPLKFSKLFSRNVNKNIIPWKFQGIFIFLMKCSFIDISVIIIFPVTTRDLIIKNTPQ